MSLGSRTDAIDRAQGLVIELRYSEALVFLEGAVSRFPDDPELRLLFGTVLADSRPDDAPEQLAEAIRLDVDNPMRLTRAARLLLTLGYLDAATSYISRAIDLTPDGFDFEAEMLNVSGLIAAAKGHDEFAEEALREAAELDATNEFFVRDLARFLADRDRTQEAVTVIDVSAPRVRDQTVILRLRHEIEP